MTTDKIEVIEGNKLIAHFMECQGLSKGESWPSDPAELKYHTSWDWLMPVVKKIRNYLDNELVRPSKNHCCKGDEIEIDIHCHMTTTNIEGVWETVVKFIIWYNQHSKPQTI